MRLLILLIIVGLALAAPLAEEEGPIVHEPEKPDVEHKVIDEPQIPDENDKLIDESSKCPNEFAVMEAVFNAIMEVFSPKVTSAPEVLADASVPPPTA